ncbi:pyridoxamine 5'-phosphate oxidase family protein [Acidovorax sp. SDU_ACID1]|uniref:pyridoxamine 5'-phosphate oxidase family protein n=1 Tax=Acidovorax sp. SDU_ACID1 TaxID=3136632 RepID=UPI0038732BD5
MEARAFFLVGSASAAGACDCSYRGQGDGPLLRVQGAEVVFPDYPGNNLFNTLGNLIECDAIALLFVDFDARRSVLLQGRARIGGALPDWPGAPRSVAVCVELVSERDEPGLPRLVWKEPPCAS